MAEWWINIGTINQIALIAICSLFLFQMYHYILYMGGIIRKFGKTERVTSTKDAEKLTTTTNETELTRSDEEKENRGVSVIICAKNEYYNLKDFLQVVLSQDYPLFEVIVVNDGSEDDTQTLLEQYRNLYPTLHLTFVPQHSMVHSTKKLGLTLAVKAAQYEYLLLTDADCVPDSNQWIRQMMRGFDKPEIEVVLGYGGYFRKPTLLNRFIQYETLTTAMLYLGMAICGHPYMGVGRNLAYKKSTFFSSGGFSNMLQEKAGDDDLFINKVATRKNTAVVVGKQSTTWSVPKERFKDWRTQKYRHLSVAHAYRFSTKLRLTFEPLTRALWYIAVILISIYALKGVLLPIIGWLTLGLFAGRLLTQIIIIDATAYKLRSNMFGLSVIFFDIYFPLMQLSLLLKHSLKKEKEFKWN